MAIQIDLRVKALDQLKVRFIGADSFIDKDDFIGRMERDDMESFMNYRRDVLPKLCFCALLSWE